MNKIFFIIALFICCNAYAFTETTLQDQHGNYVGTSINPLVTHCISGCGGGTGSPGGSTTQVQYNNGGNFGGITGATSNGTTLTLVSPVLGAATATSINGLTISSTTGTLTLANGKVFTSNNTFTINATDGITMTTPSTSFTAARTDAANTFTGHQTIEGVTSTGATGTGSFVFGTSPTLVTPQFTGNVGINSTNPGKTLDVTGTVRANFFSGDGSALTNVPGTAGFWVAGNVGINTTSNVGIGSTNPGQALDVNGTVRATALISGTGSATITGDSNGNIGINSVTPGQRLDVIGTVRATAFIGVGSSLTSLGASNISGVVPIANLATGTPTGSKFIRDDGTLQVPAGGSSQWTTVNTNDVNFSTGNVGINSVIPTAINGGHELDIVDNVSSSPVGVYVKSISGATLYQASINTSLKTGGFTLSDNNGTNTDTNIGNWNIQRTSSPNISGAVRNDLAMYTSSGAGTRLILATEATGTKGITINSNGNVGIGTMLPNTALVINACAAFAGKAACITTTGSVGHCTAASTIVADGGCSCTAC